MKFYGKIKGGKINWQDKDKLADFIKKNEDKKVLVEISTGAEIRKIEQNSFYWKAIISQMIDLAKSKNIYLKDSIHIDNAELYNKDEWHIFFRHIYLLNYNEKLKKDDIKSTRDLTIKEFVQYCNKIIDDFIIPNGGIILEKDSQYMTV